MIYHIFIYSFFFVLISLTTAFLSILNCNQFSSISSYNALLYASSFLAAASLISSENHFFPSHIFGILNFFLGAVASNASTILSTSFFALTLTSISWLFSKLFSTNLINSSTLNSLKFLALNSLYLLSILLALSSTFNHAWSVILGS